MTPRQHSPAVLLTGFVLLLAAMFAAAYATGSAAGPVAPGMHESDIGPGGSGGGTGGSGGGTGGSGGGMGGMHGMGGARPLGDAR